MRGRNQRVGPGRLDAALQDRCRRLEAGGGFPASGFRASIAWRARASRGTGTMQHYLRDQIDWPQAFPA